MARVNDRGERLALNEKHNNSKRMKWRKNDKQTKNHKSDRAASRVALRRMPETFMSGELRRNAK